MKCFHFSNGDTREDQDGVVSRAYRLSWARSLSVASTTLGTRTSEFDSHSNDFSDTFAFHDFLSQRRANHLRVFSFSDLKSATRGFSRALLIGEGGFGCVYKGLLKFPNHDSKMEVAIKLLNRNGQQACYFFLFCLSLPSAILFPFTLNYCINLNLQSFMPN